MKSYGELEVGKYTIEGAALDNGFNAPLDNIGGGKKMEMAGSYEDKKVFRTWEFSSNQFVNTY